ncbi:MAG: hypothetical protein EOO86_05105 [Pedobacter sp.]|nr:MAG: hypothetical protein EOO86_05105 [Pedobacter sp.]
MFSVKTISFKATLLLGSGIVISSCGSSKYAATEKIYKEKTKEFAKIITSTPPVGQLYDTLNPTNQQWIGSVNFGIRKPNFVILHHTAQDSLAQTTANFIGHSDIAPKRKPDPNKFPWKKLALKGFGFWYDDILKNPPVDFDTTNALKLMGYDTSDIGATITAFKRHFIQTDIMPKLTPVDILVLYNVYTKY